MSIGSAVDATGVSYPTLAGAVEHMQKLGILKEITGKQRDRAYAYAEYLAILNEGAESSRITRKGGRVVRALDKSFCDVDISERL